MYVVQKFEEIVQLFGGSILFSVDLPLDGTHYLDPERAIQSKKLSVLRDFGAYVPVPRLYAFHEKLFQLSRRNLRPGLFELQEEGSVPICDSTKQILYCLHI